MPDEPQDPPKPTPSRDPQPTPAAPTPTRPDPSVPGRRDQPPPERKGSTAGSTLVVGCGQVDSGSWPEHRISVTPSRALEVVNADVIVEVQADDEKLGELRVSRGSIDWVPRKHRIGTSLTWEQFDRLMAEEANR